MALNEVNSIKWPLNLMFFIKRTRRVLAVKVGHFHRVNVSELTSGGGGGGVVVVVGGDTGGDTGGGKLVAAFSSNSSSANTTA